MTADDIKQSIIVKLECEFIEILGEDGTHFEGTIEEAKNIYKSFYKEAVFTTVSDSEIHMKQAVNTNKCLIHLHKHGNKLLISSVIDNLTKGASGQAIHNMNLMFGWPENEGLKLKANYF